MDLSETKSEMKASSLLLSSSLMSMETLMLDKTTSVALPSEMLANVDILDAFFSMDIWNQFVSPELKERLKVRQKSTT